MQFDRATCRMIAKDMEQALQAVAKKYNVSIKCAGGRFTDTTLTGKFEISSISKDGTVITKELETLRQLHPEWENKVFENMGERYKIIGYKIKARKRPVIAESLTNGNHYVFPSQSISRILTKAA